MHRLFVDGLIVGRYLGIPGSLVNISTECRKHTTIQDKDHVYLRTSCFQNQPADLDLKYNSNHLKGIIQCSNRVYCPERRKGYFKRQVLTSKVVASHAWVSPHCYSSSRHFCLISYSTLITTDSKLDYEEDN